METCDDDAENALTASTTFRRLDTAGDFSLVECSPHTGRQHQIRVHLEHLGHPIVGDKLYGMDEDEAYRYFESKFISAEAQARLIIPRHALHAAQIKFVHPVTQAETLYRTDLPPDLKEFFESQKNPTLQIRKAGTFSYVPSPAPVPLRRNLSRYFAELRRSGGVKEVEETLED
jgi:hypothetical protein